MHGLTTPYTTRNFLAFTIVQPRPRYDPVSVPTPFSCPANTFFPLRYVACLNTAGYQERAHHEMHRVVNTLNHNWFTAGGGSAVPKIPRPGDTADGECRVPRTA